MWYVPISYVTAANPDFSAENTKPKTWIDKNTLLRSLVVDSTNEWIIINPDARGMFVNSYCKLQRCTIENFPGAS